MTKPVVAAMPHSERVERAVLGACLVDGEAARIASKRLSAASFYDPAASDVFNAVKSIVDADRAPDAALLEDALKQAGKWEQVCKAAYLDATIDAVPGVAQLDSEIDALLGYQRARDGIVSMRRLSFGLSDGSIDCIEAASRLSGMASAMLPAAPARAPADVLDDLIDGQEVGTVRLPLGELETWIGPVFPGQKIIIAGVTSVGKTAMLVTLWVACLQRGIPCVYLSLEDSEEEIVSRAAGSLGWLTWGAILARKWGGEEAKNEGRRISAWLRSAPGAFAYLPGCSRDELALAVSRAVTKDGAKIVIVDYVQAVGDDGTSRNQQIARALSEMSRAAKPTAALVVGSQLNRAAVMGGRPPELHDLRDSGVLEQDARAVVLLSQVGDETMEGKGKDEHPVKRSVLLNIAKNKTGRKGAIQGTLWLRHSCLWPGDARPPFYTGRSPLGEQLVVPAGMVEDVPPPLDDDNPFCAGRAT